MNKFVNTAILANPLNWVMITVVLIFAAYCGYVVTNAAKNGIPSLTGN